MLTKPWDWIPSSVCIAQTHARLPLGQAEGSCLEILRGESPALGEAGSDSASPMSPRTSKSRMSMKLRRSSGSANKT
ncbi:hypothetical protein FQA47_010385 [Oryzias melastigma]|uniref:Uncharacterized protein n=1 Tax=Oryzias melastigma TaxID=30732 RepID=A0A834CLL2_ORYME|nr:hypothetical protein FQA47_010385 [Oryzias melastigma]